MLFQKREYQTLVLLYRHIYSETVRSMILQCGFNYCRQLLPKDASHPLAEILQKQFFDEARQRVKFL